MGKKRIILQVTDHENKLVDDMFLPADASVIEYAQRLANHLIRDGKVPAGYKVQRVSK